MAVGRISGPLLKANLLRDGVPLAFETDLLYLDVVNGRIGVKTTAPTDELYVNGTSRTTDLLVDTQATLATFTISGSTISSSSGTINIEPTGASPVVYQAKIQVDDLTISGNTIESLDDITIRTNGTGVVNIQSNVEVNGNVHATGNITADGDITFGAGAQTQGAGDDTVTFVAEVASDIIPDIHNTYQLGTVEKKWADVYTENLFANAITTGDIVVDGINLILIQGNIIYVSVNGDDGNSGTHEQDPYLTVKYALSQAVSGDTIYIYPGVYAEIFPITIPVGVTVRGSSMRSVKIIPTSGTRDKDAFLLNGETTVEDVTLANFEYNAGDDTGYAFRFAANMLVTTRSPYIRNITVITFGSTVRLATAPADDPRGYLAGDAGRGAFADGSVVNASSKEATMLFHAVTFITPAAETLKLTNGVRIEWLNSFSYFGSKGIHAYSSSAGFAGAGKTRLRINTRTDTWAVGNTVSYYDTDGTTLLASGTIASIEGNFVNLTGRCIGFETITDRIPTTIYAQGNAKLSTAQKKFGTASLALDGVGDYISHAPTPDFAFPSTITRLPKTITVNGTAAVSATQSKFGGSSIAFSGANGTYLGLASNTDFGFGTGDFTIEGWIYKTTTATQYLFDTRTTLTENSVAIQSNGSGTLRLVVNGAFVLTSSNAHTNNAWNHVAICRASGITRAFINGVASTTTYTDATNYGTTKPLVVGAQYNGTTAFAGYIDDFRVSNTARYTATFTPTTTAFVDDFNTKLLVNGNSTIVDDASYGTATDFTIEGWIYPTVGSTYHTIFDFRSTATEKAIYLGIDASNQIYLYVDGVYTITTSAISVSSWTHVALVRYNATTKIYVNGTQSGSSWADITNYGTSNPLRIGADLNGNYGFTGYIDEVKISNGIARYTTTFTAPTVALTGDNDTVLLLHFNGVNNSTAILDDGVTRQDIRTSAGGTASIINFADYSDFGAEVRSIGSACVYGEYGVYADGPGVILYLISENFGYIGSGRFSTNDPNDRIAANEVVELNGAKVYYTSVDNEGNFKVGDNFFINQKTGEVNFNNQSLTVTTADGFIFDNGVTSTTVTAEGIDTGNLRISGNTIESLTGEVNVTAASGQINLQNNTSITGDLDVTGTVTIGGNITIGDQSSDTISFVAGINSNLVPATTGLYDLGTSSLRWQNLYLSGNFNTTGNMTVTGNISSTGYLQLSDVRISGNTVETTTTDTDLRLLANGTGNVFIEGFKADANNLQSVATNSDITLTPQGTGGVIINNNTSLKIPVGTDAGRPASPTNGMIRYNTTRSQYEGWNGTYWLKLSGVQDVAGTTYIKAEATPGVNDNTLYFYANSLLTATLTETELTVPRFQTTSLDISDNTISTLSANQDINFLTLGTGGVKLGNFKFRNNTIQNTVSGAISELSQTGTGYVKFAGTSGFVIPSGNATTERPSNPVIGMVRFNSEYQLVEVYNGLVWTSVAGTSSGVSFNDATQIGIAMTLTLG
jgi:hypothetical protein